MISSMKYVFSLFLLMFGCIQIIDSQPLVINWQQCYGGSDSDIGKVIANAGNGFYLFCTTNSNDGEVTGNHGITDFWVVRTDSVGQVIWSITYGGSDYDNISQVKPTNDGDFIMLGNTESNDGDVNGNHGAGDYWVVKINSSGNIIWQKCFGGSFFDVAADIDSTGNSGFICQGYSNSVDGEVSGNHGNFDYWVVRFDDQGNIKWSNSYGGSMADFGLSITSTHDGGSILGGGTGIDDGDVQCGFDGGDFDAWLVKLDSTGAIQWQQCYGGSLNDNIYSIIELSNGDYLCAGNTTSDDGQVTGNHGSIDFCVLRIDHNGNLLDQRCFGGSDVDVPYFIKTSTDGNFLVGGYTFSNNGDVSGNHSDNGYSDMWLIIITPDLNLIWQQCIGGDRDEQCTDLLDLGSGKYILLGYSSTADISGNFNCNNHGGEDVWLLSVTDTTYNGIHEASRSKYFVNVYPNPAGRMITFNYYFPLSDKTHLRILNTLGEMIEDFSIFDSQGSKTWNFEGISSGIYYYILSNDSVSKSGKIVILRE